MANLVGSENSNNGNNGNRSSGTANEIRKIIHTQRARDYDFREQLFQQKVICPHKAIDGLRIELGLLAENGGLGNNPMYDRNKTVKCLGEDGCGDIFDMDPYTDEELNRAMYILYSAAQQIKVVDNGSVELDAATKEDLKNTIAVFPAIGNMIRVYRKVMNNATGNNKNRKKQNKGGNKGGFGMPTGGIGGGRVYN